MSSVMNPTTGINEQNFTQSGTSNLSFIAITNSNCSTCTTNAII